MAESDPILSSKLFFVIVGISISTIGIVFLLIQRFFNDAFLRWYGRIRRSYPIWFDRPEDVETIYSRAVVEFETKGRVEINTYRQAYYLPEYSTCVRRFHVFFGIYLVLFGLVFAAIGILA